MGKLMEKAGDGMRSLARNLCGRVPQEKRIAIIVTAFCLFAILNILVMARAIFSIGRDKERIENVEQVNLEQGAPATDDTLSEADSIRLGMEAFFDKHFNSSDDDPATRQ